MNVHLQKTEEVNGPSLLDKYHALHKRGLFKSAEDCLEQAIIQFQYPPAIRQAALLTLNGHGNQPPNREEALAGFRKAARAGDDFSALCVVMLSLTTRLFIAYRPLRPATRPDPRITNPTTIGHA